MRRRSSPTLPSGSFRCRLTRPQTVDGLREEPETLAMRHSMHQDRGPGHGRPPGQDMASQLPAGHDRHAGHSVAMFRDKFWLSFALTIPVIIWSHEVQHWLGYTAPGFPESALIPAILGTIVFFYGGLVFL